MLRHVGITVRSLQRAISFYRDILGLKIKREMLEEGEYIDSLSRLKKIRVKTVKMSADDGSLIELLCYESHAGKSFARKICDKGYSHVAFTVENIDYEYGRLKKMGIKFNCTPLVSPDKKAKVVFCRDPEGNLIELVEELKPQS
jgi:catechol 2,3-dioxygenase-like lactoylglutathione lyase family enzyme